MGLVTEKDEAAKHKWKTVIRNVSLLFLVVIIICRLDICCCVKFTFPEHLRDV